MGKDRQGTENQRNLKLHCKKTADFSFVVYLMHNFSNVLAFSPISREANKGHTPKNNLEILNYIL
jgi:hypothetical protein